jgi:predicted aspartyl protease
MWALIDTGSSLTVVNPQVAATWKLRHTGFVEVSAAGNKGRYRQYAAKISFPGTALKGFDVIPVVACPLPGQPISCLIGRDLLRRWQFTYNGRTGEYTVSDIY